MQTVTERSASLMQQLKVSTAELHKFAESRELQRALFKGAASPVTFRRYLIELHAVHVALERGLAMWRAQQPELASVFSDEQMHSRNLELDIVSLARLTDSTAAAEFGARTSAAKKLIELLAEQTGDDPFALLGCLYVLEGSMNGNRFLYRALSKAWQIDRHGGLRYLDPYGDAQQENWQKFRLAMDALDANETNIARAVESACRTFEAIAAISDAISAGEEALAS